MVKIINDSNNRRDPIVHSSYYMAERFSKRFFGCSPAEIIEKFFIDQYSLFGVCRIIRRKITSCHQFYSQGFQEIVHYKNFRE